jgi:glycosyltransferase involved in cell wall biosynthesis
MKLLVVGNRVPWPLHDGGAIATYGMLRSLAENGAEVHFFTFNTKKHFAENATIEKYFGFCKVYLQPLDAGVKAVKALLNLFTGKSYHMERYEDNVASVALGRLMDQEAFDAVLVEGLYSVPVYLRAVSARKHRTPAAYRAHNLEYQIWARLAAASPNPVKKWYLGLQANRLKKFEQRTWSAFQAIVPIVTTDEIAIKMYLDRTIAKSSNKQIPAIQTYQPGISIERPFAFIHQPLSLFHIGSMEWQANEQGVLWFLQKVWPLLLVKYPQAQFHLAGKGLSKSDPRFFQTGVVNHGEVSDAEDFMHQHGIMVVPIQAGSGIRIKTLEAMALGVPVVSTSVGAQGLSVTSGTEMFIADQPQQFADAIATLLANPAQAQTLTTQARAYVEQHHNLKRNTADLLAFLGQL